MRQATRRWVVFSAALEMLAVIATAPALAAGIEVASDLRPEVLDRLSTDGELLSAALSSDGTHAAAAYAVDASRRTRLVIYSLGVADPATLDLPGLVRDLLFAPDGSGLYGILYRPARKRLGTAELIWVGVGDSRHKTALRLAPTASDLDYWAERDALLIAARDEITTLRLDGLRSGRLYRVLGDNLSLASLASSDLLLVGQQDSLMLIGLDDPPGEEQMPNRGRIDVDSPVVGLAASRDGKEALALLGDGRLFRVDPWPLEMDSAGTAIAVVSRGKSDDRRPLPVPTEPAAARVPTDPVSADPAPPERQSPAPQDPVATTAPAGSGEDAASIQQPPPARPIDPAAAVAVADMPREQRDTPTSADTPAPTAATSAESAGSAAPAVEPSARSAPGGGTESSQLWGRIEGPAAGDVEEVVLLGPNNILVEARRIRPDRDGTWRTDDLAPGRYQIQLSGGRNRVIVAEPRLAMVEVDASGSTEARTFRVLRAYAP